jgi:hypothetical protein
MIWLRIYFLSLLFLCQAPWPDFGVLCVSRAFRCLHPKAVLTHRTPKDSRPLINKSFESGSIIFSILNYMLWYLAEPDY